VGVIKGSIGGVYIKIGGGQAFMGRCPNTRGGLPPPPSNYSPMARREGGADAGHHPPPPLGQQVLLPVGGLFINLRVAPLVGANQAVIPVIQATIAAIQADSQPCGVVDPTQPRGGGGSGIYKPRWRSAIHRPSAPKMLVGLGSWSTRYKFCFARSSELG